jgi:hypothetical protein
MFNAIGVAAQCSGKVSKQKELGSEGNRREKRLRRFGREVAALSRESGPSQSLLVDFFAYEF